VNGWDLDGDELPAVVGGKVIVAGSPGYVVTRKPALTRSP